MFIVFAGDLVWACICGCWLLHAGWRCSVAALVVWCGLVLQLYWLLWRCDFGCALLVGWGLMIGGLSLLIVLV